MKKVLVILALSMFSFANAQKGSILVAGNVSYTSQKTGSVSSDEFVFAPKVGYQFSDKMTAGLEMSVGNSNFTNNDSENNFSLGAFLRYAVPLSGVFSAYADLGVGMQSSEFMPNTGSDVKSDGFYVGLVPAIGVDLKKGFCLNFSIGGLGYDSLKPSGGDATDTFNFSFGKQASVGISKNF